MSSSAFYVWGTNKPAINNSKFIDNFAHTAAMNFGGAIYINNGVTANIINSSFINNSAKYGSGIFNSGNLNIIDSSFTSNNASYGGAVYNAGPNVSIILTNSSFVNNSPTSYEGVIHNKGNLSIDYFILQIILLLMVELFIIYIIIQLLTTQISNIT